MQLKKWLKIPSLKLESEYLQIRQLYLTVYYGSELMKFGGRWSHLHHTLLTVDASVQMTFIGLLQAKLLNEMDYRF